MRYSTVRLVILSGSQAHSKREAPGARSSGAASRGVQSLCFLCMTYKGTNGNSLKKFKKCYPLKGKGDGGATLIFFPVVLQAEFCHGTTLIVILKVPGN